MKMRRILFTVLVAFTGISALPVEEGQVDDFEVDDLINYDIDPMLSVSDSELRSISSRMWNDDSSRFSNNDFSINSAGPTFFTYVNEGRFSRSTYNRFRPLLNNFIPDYGVSEPPCQRCRSAEDLWLNNVISSGPMRRAWDFLISKGLASSNTSTFKRLLKQLWFQFYSRSRGPIDSCGFEHVFVGEQDRGSVKGFHNWVMWYQEEKEGELSLRQTRRTCNRNLVSVQYDWLGSSKSYGSMFIGTSPEFEIALYTLCFLTRNEDCRTSLGGRSVTITTYPMNNVSPRTISTAFPGC